MAHVQYLPFVFYEIIHQSLAQILEAHVIENMIATSKRISKRCVVTRCRAQEDTSIVHSLVPSEPGGQVGRSFLNVGRSGWAEGPEYTHHINTSPFGFSDLPKALLSRAHIQNAESAPLTKRTKNQHATVGYNPNWTD